MIYAYGRVSTLQQDVDNQRLAIVDYISKKSLGTFEIIEETESGKKTWKNRKLGILIEDTLKKGDILIVTELSRLGRKMLEVMEILSILTRNKVEIHIIKGDIVLKPNDIYSSIYTMVFAMAAEIEREFISQRTKMALERARRNGKKLGRPRGSFSSKMDTHKEKIEELLKLGVSMKSISKILDVKYTTLVSYIKKLKKKK